MQQQVKQIIQAADAVKAATQIVCEHADIGACTQFIEALDTLEAATETLRRIAPLPKTTGLWQRQISVGAIYWPSMYFDATYNGEALEELVAELQSRGTCGTPRATTDAVCVKIRAGAYDGLIASVSMPYSDAAAFRGVIACESFEALVSRAIEWGVVVSKTFIAPGNIIPLDAHRECA